MRAHAFLLASMLILNARFCSAEDGATTVQIENGKVSGALENGIRIYKGLPFAATTAGENRWKPPQPVARWNGIRECTKFGPECPQAPYAPDSMYYRPPQPQSEDCLYLNVWTGAKKPDEKLPVMVWIHGGALTRGSGGTATYDGSNLTKKGVVVVTINYRLGPLGYLAHPELSKESQNHASGNYGVLDQVAALKWVKQNIAAFGGDPGRVTIFGESAGSFSVNVLVASPLASGLFHRAIGESGGVLGPMTWLSKDFDDRPSAEKMGETFAKAGGANSLADLRKMPPEQLIDIAEKKFPRGSTAFRATPNVDGWVLPDEMRTIFAGGKQNDVPTIVGSNAKEMTTLTPPAIVPKTLEGMRKAFKEQFKEAAGEIEALYPAKTDAEAADAYLAASRDRTFTAQMRAWASYQSKTKSKAYWYYFTRVPNIPNKQYLGAFHAAEIQYVFNNLNSPNRTYEPIDKQLAETMSNYWVNFAKTGDPNGEGLPKWPAYDEKEEPCMVLGDEVKADHHLNQKQLDLIDKTVLQRRD